MVVIISREDSDQVYSFSLSRMNGEMFYESCYTRLFIYDFPTTVHDSRPLNALEDCDSVGRKSYTDRFRCFIFGQLSK